MATLIYLPLASDAQDGHEHSIFCESHLDLTLLLDSRIVNMFLNNLTQALEVLSKSVLGKWNCWCRGKVTKHYNILYKAR